MEEIAAYLRARTGLTIPEARRAAVAEAVEQLAREARCEDLAGYLARVRREPALFHELVAAVAVGETYFFREPAQFEALRTEVLPRLRVARPPGHTLRVWSAGCSTGEEAYSLAIVVAEAWGGPFEVTATDLVPRALARARAGRYTAWSLRGVAEAAVRRYFEAHGDGREIRDVHRAGVTFATGNLLVDRPGGYDVVFCRNVLVYFDAATVRVVAGALFGALAEGGFVFTACTDPAIREYAGWESVATVAGEVLRRPFESATEATARAVRSSALLDAGAAVVRVADGDGVRGAGDGDAVRSAEEEAVVAALVRRVAAGGAGALADCEAALRRHRLVAGLHHVHALLLLGSGRLAEAEDAARRAVYLDRGFVMAHVAVASIARCRGRAAIAGRSLRNAAELVGRLADDAVVPLADGATAAELRAVLARVQQQQARRGR